MKTKLLPFIIFFLTISVFSQGDKERIQALKVAHITNALELTQEEAIKFWPIYNKFDEENHKLKAQGKNHRGVDFETLTEKEAEALLKEINNIHEKRAELMKKYMKDLEDVLSAKKILMLRKAEDDFKHKMFEEYKKRKGKRH